MKNKIIKLISLILLITMIFNINMKDVSALRCEWKVYPTYIAQSDKDGQQYLYSTLIDSYTLKYLGDGRFKLMYDENTYGDFIHNPVLGDLIEMSNECPSYMSVKKGKNISISDKATFVEYLKTKQYLQQEQNKNFYDSLLVDTIMSNVQSTYPVKEKNRLNNAGMTDDEIKEKLGIDTSEKGFDKDYFNLTKDIWYSAAKKNITGNKIDSSEILRPKNDNSQTENKGKYNELKYQKAFKSWFEIVSRWVLEESGIEVFKEYYKLAYGAELSESQLENNLSIFSSIEQIEEKESELNNLKNNKCLAICTAEGTAQNQCMNGAGYKTCVSAQQNCKNISSASAQEACLKQQMGDDLYNTFQTSYNDRINELNGKIKKAKSELKTALSHIGAPDLDIRFERYKLVCEDISFLHKLYMVLRIMAPVLVILFGTIDFAKAVVAGDEKKMQESRKKFPKRVVLLVLFILVPIIIEILIDLFSISDTSIMRCVINGV